MKRARDSPPLKQKKRRFWQFEVGLVCPKEFEQGGIGRSLNNYPTGCMKLCLKSHQGKLGTPGRMEYITVSTDDLNLWSERQKQCREMATYRMSPFIGDAQKRQIPRKQRQIYVHLGPEGGTREWQQMDSKVLLQWWKHSQIGLWWCLHNSVNVVKITEPYSQCKWILWHVNYTSIKLFFKKCHKRLNTACRERDSEPAFILCLSASQAPCCPWIRIQVVLGKTTLLLEIYQTWMAISWTSHLISPGCTVLMWAVLGVLQRSQEYIPTQKLILLHSFHSAIRDDFLALWCINTVMG